MISGVAGELAANQVQVIGVVAVRIGDPAVPAGQACAIFNSGTQTFEFLRLYCGHGVALHDQIHSGHVVGIGVDGRAFFNADAKAVRTQVRDE